MGHQQVLDYATRYVAGRSQHALICGTLFTCMMRTYLGCRRANAQWRGIIVCHDVVGGSYSPIFQSAWIICVAGMSRMELA